MYFSAMLFETQKSINKQLKTDIEYNERSGSSLC